MALVYAKKKKIKLFAQKFAIVTYCQLKLLVLPLSKNAFQVQI